MSDLPDGGQRPAQTGWRPPPGGYQPVRGWPPSGTGDSPPPAQPEPGYQPSSGYQTVPGYQGAFRYPPEYGLQYPAPAASAEGRGYTVASFICAGIAVLFLPFVVGPLGAVMGKVGLNKGDPVGKWGMVTSIITSFLGTALIAVILLTVD